MTRVQVQLADETARALRSRAKRAGRPVASLVRDAVDAWLEADARRDARDRAMQSIGGFHSGLGDLAEEHDRYLADEDR
ncbi:MAG TPA: ribbon-helix-helix protein, CopG family [Candidatus Limnocylindrales bacterium]|nr:ribbon-helix-helix protein, CopG family [Candidatus Limnocylindrales bacterium]